MKNNQIILIAVIAVIAGATGFVFGDRYSSTPILDTMTDSRQSDSAVGTEPEILYWQAPMNPTEIYDQPGKSAMGMDLEPVYADGTEDAASNLVSINPVTVQNMGVRTADVEKMDFSRGIRAVGEVTYDEENLFQVTARVSGWIEKLHINYVGAPVQKGDPLLEIYSPELVTTQEEYLLAYQQIVNARKSGQSVTLGDAEKLLRSARRRLENWEIPDEVIRELEESGEPARTVLLRAPATGVVNKKFVVEGAYVAAGADLLRLADLSTVWVHASFYEDEVPWIRVGQPVEMELSYLPGNKYKGTVSYIYPYLREKARDVHVRLIFSNPSLDLKPGMYVNVQLDGRVIPDALVVPSEAIIRSGQRMMAFVSRGEGQFEPREIEIGEEGGPRNSYVRVLSGLSQGESVVVSAQFLLDSESRLQEAIRKMLQPDAIGTSSESQEMPAIPAAMPDMPDMESGSEMQDADSATEAHNHEG